MVLSYDLTVPGLSQISTFANSSSRNVKTEGRARTAEDALAYGQGGNRPARRYWNRNEENSVENKLPRSLAYGQSPAGDT